MRLKQKIYYLFFMLVSGFDLVFFIKLRGFFVKGFLNQKVTKLFICSNVHLYGYRKLKIGNDVSINHGCFLSCDGGVQIGDFVSIGHNTSIISTEHTYDDKDTPIKYQPIQFHPVEIGNNVWIGANVTILAGVTIPEGTVVAAGAVVTKSVIEKNTIIGGVPAHFLKDRIK